MGRPGSTMRGFLVVCFLAAASAKPQGNPAVGFADGRIIGGEEAPPHEFPWQISLRNLGSHICGGSIINKNQVIRLGEWPRWSITPAGTILLSTTMLPSSLSQNRLTSATPTCNL